MASIRESAASLQVSPESVYRHIAAGRLEATRKPGVRGMIVSDESLAALQNGYERNAGTGLLSTGQVARQLGVSAETVRQLIRDGKLKANKYGDHNSPLRIPVESLEEFKNGTMYAATEVVA